MLQLLQGKDVPSLREPCAQLDEPLRSALLALPDALRRRRNARRGGQGLPALPEVTAALETLRQLQASLPDLPLSFDLADLRGYHYHNGVVFAAYCPDFSSAIARGGRYDGVGRAFGRARPATGFRWTCANWPAGGKWPVATGAILAPCSANRATLAAAIAALRAQGEVVVELLPAETRSEGPLCDRQLVERDGQWLIEAITGTDQRNG
jgi:ATP phosphoribosyltransferase regulatory subunit